MGARGVSRCCVDYSCAGRWARRRAKRTRHSRRQHLLPVLGCGALSFCAQPRADCARSHACHTPSPHPAERFEADEQELLEEPGLDELEGEGEDMVGGGLAVLGAGWLVWEEGWVAQVFC